MAEIITLNVGGCIYQTTLSTLAGAPGSLGFWFSQGVDSGLVPAVRDPEGRYFIDRDGKHFGKVLNYVRDGCERITLPPSREIRQELRAEADYYNLTSLIEMIDQHEAGLVRREEATSAAMASLIFDAMEAVTAADNLSKMFAELGTTRQTELAVRLPALQLKIQTALLRLVDAHVRSHGTL